jgi:hypothetical protein
MLDNSAAPHLNGRCRSSGTRLSAVMAKGEVDEFFLFDREKRDCEQGYTTILWYGRHLRCYDLKRVRENHNPDKRDQIFRRVGVNLTNVTNLTCLHRSQLTARSPCSSSVWPAIH